MTTPAAAAPPAHPPSAPSAGGPSSGKTVRVSVDELIIGRSLQFPLHDASGVLLLAAGQVVTPEFKRKLKLHRVASVELSIEDAERLTLRAFEPPEGSVQIVVDSELAERLDALIDCGLLSVINREPPVKTGVVFLGRRNYDPKLRAELADAHQRNTEALGRMMRAPEDARQDGTIVSLMAVEYLKQLTLDADSVLTSAADLLEDDDLVGRSIEVALLAMAMGVEMDLDAANVRDLCISGLVHDWGMIKVPLEIRKATRRLTPLEQMEIKKHPIHSLEILQRISSLPPIASVVAYQVHERFNGTGYPRGRHGTSIHLFARILHVADMYVALTRPRPDRAALMPYSAMELILRKARERSCCPDVVKALLKTLSLFPLNSHVMLSDGSVARVLRRNGELYTKPIVLRVQRPDGTAADPNDSANIVDLAEGSVSVAQALPSPGKNEVSFSEDRLLWNC